MIGHVAVNNNRFCAYKKKNRYPTRGCKYGRQVRIFSEKTGRDKYQSASKKEEEYTKWLIGLRDVVLGMVQDTIAHEEELTTTKWQSKLEEKNKLEYVDHANFEIVVILHKMFDNQLWKNKQFDDIQSELQKILKLQSVNMLFNTNNFDKILKHPDYKNRASFLWIYEVAQTKRGKKYSSKTKKIQLQFKTLAELPERVCENPQFYKYRVQQIIYLMQSNPIPYMLNLHCQDLEIYMWMAIYSLLLGISFQNKQYALHFHCQKLLLNLLQDMSGWSGSEDQKLFNILGYASLKSGIQKVRERTFSQTGFEMLSTYLGQSVLCDFYCAYISTYKSEIFIEGYVQILKTLLFHKNRLRCQYYSIDNFDDGIVMYRMDTKLGTYQDSENNENSIEMNQKMNYEGEPHWEYVTHLSKQLPVTQFTWVTHNESVLASLGTPLLNVALMMLRLTGLLLQKESQLTPRQIQDSFIVAYEWLQQEDDSGQNIQCEISENLRLDMLQWVYEKFYELGGLSLLIALNNYRTENFARKQTFDIDTLKEYLVKERDLLGEKGEDPFYEKFLSMILEGEYYGEEIRGEMLLRRFCVPEMISQWLFWLEDFQGKHTNFVQLWNNLPTSWENVSHDQLQQIYLSSTQLTEVVQNLVDLHPVVVELILKLAPHSVMDAALQSKSNKDMFKLVLCKLIMDSNLQQKTHELPLQNNNAEEVHRVFKQIYAKQYLSGELLRQDVQEYHFNCVFNGDAVQRGLKSPILDVNMIKILLQILEMCYQDSSERLPLLSKIVTYINKNDVFTANMFEILTQYLTQWWGLQQDQIMQFLVAQQNGMQTSSIHILDDILEQQLMACLKSQKHHMHAYNNIDVLNENQAAQVRILIALFEDVCIDISQLIQWVTKLQSVVPNACVQCDILLSFLSVIDDSLDWITRYATHAQINQIICSKSCGAKLKHELVEYSLQNNLLQQNSCDYLLQQQKLSQDQIQQLLQYLHTENFVVGMNALKNISQQLSFKNIEIFSEIDPCLVNGLIFASYQINKPQQALQFFDFISQHEMCQFSFDWKGLSDYTLALHQQNFDNTYIYNKIQPYLKPGMIFSDKYKSSISEIPCNDLETVFDIILDQQQNLYKDIFNCILNNSGMSIQNKVQVLLPKISFCLDEFDSEEEKNIQFVNQVFDYALQTNYDSYEILQQLFTILKVCPTWKFTNQSIFSLTQQLLNENNFRGINAIFQPQFLNFQQQFVQKQWQVIFNMLVSKFQDENFVALSDDLQYFLLLFFNYSSLKFVSDYLIQFCILLLSNSNENITFIQKLFNESFSGEIDDLEQLTLLLDKFGEMEVEPKLPDSLILFLDENIEILTGQLRMKTLSYCTIVTQSENSQICLHCYDILHSKYKHEITPQIWQAALVNATLLEHYKKGFEILQHVPVERRRQEKQWEIRDAKIQSAEIILEIKGGQDFERGWDLITKFWNESGVLPQKEIKILVEFLANLQNPHTCGVILKKIFDSLQPLFFNYG